MLRLPVRPRSDCCSFSRSAGHASDRGPLALEPAGPTSGHRTDHVLLISVDGMHQSDLDWYVAHHPGSRL